METVQRQTGKTPAQLENVPDLPDLGRHIWKYFLELHEDRGSNGVGPNRISSLDMMMWQGIEGIRLKRWEIRAIKLIDNAWMKSQRPSND